MLRLSALILAVDGRLHPGREMRPRAYFIRPLFKQLQTKVLLARYGPYT